MATRKNSDEGVEEPVLTGFTEAQKKELAAPLDEKNVKKNAKNMDYVEGWFVIDEANRIFGFDGWDRETVSMDQVEPHYVTKSSRGDDQFRVAYRAKVRILVYTPGRTIVRDGTGYGSGMGKDLNDTHESASKEAETDAMKRAFMTFGNKFGLALYDKAKTNVLTEADKRRIAAEEEEIAFVNELENDLSVRVAAIDDLEELRKLHTEQTPNLKRVGAYDRGIRDRLAKLFTDRKEALLKLQPAQQQEAAPQAEQPAPAKAPEPKAEPEATVEQPAQEQQEQAGETMSDEDYVFLRDLETGLTEKIDGISDIPALTKLYKENKADLMKATSIDKVWGNKIVDLFSAKRVKIEAQAPAQAEPSVTSPQAPPQSTITELRTGQQPDPEPEPEGLKPEQIIDPNRLKREDNPAVNDWPEFRKRAINTVRRIVNEDVLDQWIEAHAKWIKQVGGLTTVGEYPNGTEMTGDNVRNDINLWVHRQRSIIRGTNLTMLYGEGKLASDRISHFADVNDWAQHLSDLANSETRWMNVKYNVEQAEALAEQHKGEDVAGVIRAALSIYKDQIAASARKSA